MIEWIKKLLVGFSSNSMAGSVARAVIQLIAGGLTALGIEQGLVDNFSNAALPILSALFLILIGLLGSAKSKKS